MPDQPDSHRAEWLGLVAAWHIKYRHDSDTGRKTLERLIREFPQTAQAFAARRRLQLLDAAARK
jgi:TolA-binding protein